MKAVQREPIPQVGSVRETLKRSDLFCGLTDQQLDRLLPLCREEVYEASVVAFPEGQPCDTIYIVHWGKVALEMDLRISRAAEESATYAVVTETGSLCCSGLIDLCILNDTGRTLERTGLIALDTAELKQLLEDAPDMRCKIMGNLAAVIFSRLAHTRDTLGHVLSVVFHDLKAPLAATESYLRVMLGGFAGDLSDDQRDMLQRSSTRLSELLNVISHMTDVSRVDARDLVMTTVSLAQVVSQSIDAMQPLAREKGLLLQADIPDHLPLIQGYHEQLKQVLANLISNGIKFTPAGGMVTVRVIDRAEYVETQVRDTGIGIPPEELPKIFDDFYRGLDLAEKGAGLGLSIAKRIVEAHHGHIWATSPCPDTGKGSQFVFSLPRDLEEAHEK